ncbi:putative Calmodulin-related protein [Paratrimastix pyriformis]|uniref:Calmodulin-related protein n=1 Tax=Paratrimastix pyriformis TaxID=342808 RepID=A0ABQ8UCR8_9EUKA|nr:putative Calmodulin-related protein [Paratrimastix pyriformis]
MEPLPVELATTEADPAPTATTTSVPVTAVPADEIRLTLSEDQVEQYREAFALFDKDQDGNITTKELGTVMRSLGLAPTEAELRAMVRDVDPGNTGLIDFSVFCQLALKKLQDSLNIEEELKEAFQCFDKNHTGFVDARELRAMLTQVGEKLTDEEVDEMIREADCDSDSKVSLEEFLKMMLGNGK